jgi:hypothetical protein
MNAFSGSSLEGSEYRILGDLGVMAVQGFSRIRVKGSNGHGLSADLVRRRQLTNQPVDELTCGSSGELVKWSTGR